MTKSNLFLVAFLLVSVGEIVSVVFGSPAHFAFKPAILIMLGGYYLTLANQRNATLLGALFFCWIGDCLLMFGGEELYFMLGLLAFLVGHLFFIFAFRQFVWSQPSTLLPTQKVRYVFPVFLAGTGLIVILYPGLGALKIPVIIYATVLMIMVSTSLLRLSRTNSSSFGWVFAGAVCFMVSDSILAINKFYSSFDFANVPIMVTYVAAQYSIVRGLLVHLSK